MIRGAGDAQDLATSPDELHSRGLRELIGGRTDRALAHLERARELHPDDWRLRNDLASAYMLQGLAGDRVRYLDAHAELEAAVAHASEAPPVRFNRALVFGKLGLLEEAEGEWRAFLELEALPGWSREAERALASLRSQPSPEELRSLLRVGAREAAGPELSALVRSSPLDALSVAERDQLPRWAEALTAGDDSSATELLASTRNLGRALESVTGDAFVLRFAESVAELEVRDRRRLARAYREYLRGREHYDAREIAQAERAFASARRGSAGLATPLDFWIDYYRHLCRYWRADESAPGSLEGLRRGIEGHRLPVLEGHIAWALGLLHIEGGRFSAGLKEYRDGLRRFEATGMGEQAAMLRVLISDALMRLGEIREAWSEVLRAVVRASDYRTPRNLWAAWDQAALVATLLGRSETASYYHEAALRAALESGEPLTISNAYVFRANTSTRRELGSAAARDLERARQWSRRISDDSSRLRADAAIQAAEALVVEPGGERWEVARLSDALERYERMGAEILLPGLLLQRSRLLARSEDSEAAERDLRGALAILEAERRAIGELEWRVSFSSVARPTLDELLRFHLETSGDLEAIPALTDLARDPAYFAPLSPVASSELLGLDYAGALRLAPGEALLSVSVLGDRFLLWVLRDGRLSVVTEPVVPEELEQRLVAARERPSLDDLGWFYDRMIQPVAAELEGADRLFLALDRGLNLLPVGALYDRESRTFLVGRTAVALVPAALLLAHRSGEREVPVRRMAVLGSTAGEGLPRLPAIEAEAEAIARLYPESRVELGQLTAAGLEAAGTWADVLQFSGHAVSNPLVPGLSRLVSGDEPIYARDIRGLRMPRARTVILAACETAATTPEDSSGVLSLAVAFLEAGADWVVASLWPIDDRAARRFTERFHQELRRDPSPDRALRATQLHLLRSGEVRLEDWAGFQVITG